MTQFNQHNAEHVAIVTQAAEEAWLSVACISESIKDALLDEGIRPSELAYSIGLDAARKFKMA